jgi:predicted nucleotidyltransferase
MGKDLSWSARNPEASRADIAKAKAVARAIAREFAVRGASAVILSGSWARGDARRFSDVDLWVIGRRKRSTFLVRRGLMVSIKETTIAQELQDLQNPRYAGQVVYAWRDAIPLYDPRSIAARLKDRVARFRWSTIRRRVDRWVAQQLVGWAEEAVKLTRLMAEGRHESADVQRNLLADTMAGVVAARERLIYNENNLWEMAGSRMGPEWRRAQRRALGTDRVPFQESCESSLELYRLTVRSSLRYLKGRELPVVTRTLSVVGHPL